MTGYVHSVETCGTLDGPGLRYVLFLQGCLLRCKFCHNPDTWQCRQGRQYTEKEVIADILKYRNFIKNGGVTLSGGEPLLQAEFVTEVLKQCAAHKLHTALDTSGAVSLEDCRAAVDAADLILLDIKHIEPQKCQEITGQGNEQALRLLNHCQQTQKPVWIRHVIVPGLTDDLPALEAMARYLSDLSVVRRVEILPFHKMGEFKWRQLNLRYELEKTPAPAAETIQNIRAIFAKYGL